MLDEWLQRLAIRDPSGNWICRIHPHIVILSNNEHLGPPDLAWKSAKQNYVAHDKEHALDISLLEDADT
jgi:hypothetical protein